MKWFLRIAFIILAIITVLIIVVIWQIFNPPKVSSMVMSDIVSSKPVTFEDLKTTMC